MSLNAPKRRGRNEKRMNQRARVRGSFRDPAGSLCWIDGVLYREVRASYGEHYDHLVDSGLLAELFREELLGKL